MSPNRDFLRETTVRQIGETVHKMVTAQLNAGYHPEDALGHAAHLLDMFERAWTDGEWPSVHPDVKRSYEWLGQALDGAGAGRDDNVSPTVAQIAEALSDLYLPYGVVAFLETHREKVRTVEGRREVYDRVRGLAQGAMG